MPVPTDAIQSEQAKFRLAAKVAMLQRGLTVTALARQIRRPRNTVSMAINRGVFPKVRRRIAKALELHP